MSVSTELLWQDGACESSPNTGLRLERLVVSGPYVIEGRQIELENNVYFWGDDREVIVIDASHDAARIFEALSSTPAGPNREVVDIIITHGHADHINAAVKLAELTDARVLMNPADQDFWVRAHGHEAPLPLPLEDGQEFRIGEGRLKVLFTPGHTPGSLCLLGFEPHASDAAWVLTGDTLFPGGPGATGNRPGASFEQIIASIRDRLLTLEDSTLIYPGHGQETTVSSERGSLQEWVRRGW